MPTVPYTSVPHATLTPLAVPRLNPNAPIEAFGGGIAAQKGGLGDLSGAINAADAIGNEQQRIRLEEKAKADQIAITDAGAQLSAYKTHALYDPEQGAVNQLGKNAFDVPEKVHSEYWNVAAVIRASLATDDQRVTFDRMAEHDWSQMNEQIQEHVAAQRQRYDTETTSAFVANKRNEALTGYRDPKVVESSIAYQTAAIKDHATRNGLPDEVVKEQVAKATSATRFGVVEAMLNTEQDLAASAYFAAHREDFVASDLLQAERLTEAGSIRGESQRRADAIVTTSQSLSDAITAAHAIEDPRIRDATEQRVRRSYEDRAADQRQERAQAFEDASGIIERTGNFDRVPLSTRLKLTPEENDALERRAEHIRSPKVTTSLSLYSHLINMAALSDATRAEFIGLDLTDPKYRQQLSDADYKHVLNLQRQLRQSGGRAGATGDRRVRQKEETTVIKQSENAGKRAAAAANAERIAPGTSKYLAPPPRVTVPQWMLDSAAHDPEYREYLTMHGVPLADPSNPSKGSGNIDLAAPSAPRVPGAPIVKLQSATPAKPQNP